MPVFKVEGRVHFSGTSYVSSEITADTESQAEAIFKGDDHYVELYGDWDRVEVSTVEMLDEAREGEAYRCEETRDMFPRSVGA